jgi:phospholipid/cholesterol/gamma-HCH transport system ATP-binding protein
VSDPELAIELRDVRKAFRGKAVLTGVSLAIPVGSTFTILGGSGSGKSVCLKHMIGLLKPDAGRGRVLGRDHTQHGERERVEVGQDVSMIFQSAARVESLSGDENVAYTLREHPRRPEERFAERVRECLGRPISPRATLRRTRSTSSMPPSPKRLAARPISPARTTPSRRI